MNEIEQSLAPLFARAEASGLWFYSRYADCWFAPLELRKEQAAGRFRWGAPNWELRDPRERLEALNQQAQTTSAEQERFRQRMSGG